MVDPEIKVPPAHRKPASMKHQRRPSLHTRRRSQHSIASFGELEKVIKEPRLGSLGEDSRADHDEEDGDYIAGEVKPKKKHDRQSSNVHMLFGEDGGSPEDLFNDLNEEESMDNILHMMAEHQDLDVDGYSPKAIELDDAPESPIPPKPSVSVKNRNQSFGGIVELFGADELQTGLQNPEEEVKRLREENRKLLNELEKSNRIKKQLEQEIDALRSSKGHSTRDEIERIKTSKINLILAAVSEIDRMRKIILSQSRSNSISS